MINFEELYASMLSAARSFLFFWARRLSTTFRFRQLFRASFFLTEKSFTFFVRVEI